MQTFNQSVDAILEVMNMTMVTDDEDPNLVYMMFGFSNFITSLCKDSSASLSGMGGIVAVKGLGMETLQFHGKIRIMEFECDFCSFINQILLFFNRNPVHRSFFP